MAETRGRSLAGACVLSAVLLMGGTGGVAFADPDGSGADSGSSSSQNTSPDSDSSSPASSQSTPTATSTVTTPTTRTTQRPDVALRESVRRTVRSITSTLGTIASHGSTPSTVKPTPVTPPVTEAESGGLAAEPATAPAEAGTDAVAPLTEAVTPAPASAAPAAPQLPATIANLPAAMDSVNHTLFGVFTTTQQTVATLPALLVSLPTSTDPVGDVITTVQQMLTSVTGSVGAIASLPTELGTLLGVQPSIPTIGAGSTAASRPIVDTATSAAPTFAQLMQAPAVAAGWQPAVLDAPSASLFAGNTAVGLERQAAVSAVPLSMRGLSATGQPASLLDRAVTTLLLPISLAALAAVALPGVGGLWVLCALGIRIGYRQAKAGWAVHVAGIGRFAGPGPLGVVRSGSMIALHVRSKRVATKPAPGAVRFMDQAA